VAQIGKNVHLSGGRWHWRCLDLYKQHLSLLKTMFFSSRVCREAFAVETEAVPWSNVAPDASTKIIDVRGEKFPVERKGLASCKICSHSCSYTKKNSPLANQVLVLLIYRHS